MLFFLWTPQSP